MADVPPEPVSLVEIKKQLDVVRTDQDDMLSGMIVAAREWVESYTGLVLTRREVVQGFDRFDPRMTLFAWPIAADAVPMVECGGAPVSARLSLTRRPARLLPAVGAVWAWGGDITVTVTAGYATPAEVPFSLKAAMIVHCQDFYQTRSISPATVAALEALCGPFKLWTV